MQRNTLWSLAIVLSAASLVQTSCDKLEKTLQQRHLSLEAQERLDNSSSSHSEQKVVKKKGVKILWSPEQDVQVRIIRHKPEQVEVKPEQVEVKPEQVEVKPEQAAAAIAPAAEEKPQAPFQPETPHNPQPDESKPEETPVQSEPSPPQPSVQPIDVPAEAPIPTPEKAKQETPENPVQPVVSPPLIESQTIPKSSRSENDAEEPKSEIADAANLEKAQVQSPIGRRPTLAYPPVSPAGIEKSIAPESSPVPVIPVESSDDIPPTPTSPWSVPKANYPLEY